MKQVTFLGNSLKELRKFPESARSDAGFELGRVQEGKEPRDSKPLPTVGSGVRELRIWSEQGTFRVVFVATYKDRVYVLHAFEKKTDKTPKRDLDLARERLKELKGRL